MVVVLFWVCCCGLGKILVFVVMLEVFCVSGMRKVFFVLLFLFVLLVVFMVFWFSGGLIWLLGIELFGVVVLVKIFLFVDEVFGVCVFLFNNDCVLFLVLVVLVVWFDLLVVWLNLVEGGNGFKKILLSSGLILFLEKMFWRFLVIDDGFEIFVLVNCCLFFKVLINLLKKLLI